MKVTGAVRFTPKGTCSSRHSCTPRTVLHVDDDGDDDDDGVVMSDAWVSCSAHAFSHLARSSSEAHPNRTDHPHDHRGDTATTANKPRPRFRENSDQRKINSRRMSCTVMLIPVDDSRTNILLLI